MILSVSREINERQEAEEAALAAQNIEQEKAKNLLNIAINMANQSEGNETKNAPTENADAPVENDRTTEGNFST